MRCASARARNGTTLTWPRPASYNEYGSRKTTGKESIPIAGGGGKSVAEPEQRMRWSVERRLSFIEFRLFWEGRINRGDLVDFFAISVPQASADLARYHEAAPRNLVYDKTAKTYVASEQFQPVFFEPSADRYLAQLRAIAAHLLGPQDTMLGSLPRSAVMPAVGRRLAAATLRRLLEAVRSCSRIRVKYHSHSYPTARWRWFTPHAFGFDGARWHARAWCHERSDFRDFVLARIVTASEMKPDDVDPADDVEWETEIVLKLVPHPSMDEGTRRAVEFEYDMKGGSVDLTTRACFYYYVEHALGLDAEPETVSPKRHQLVLANRVEVTAAVQHAREESLRRRSANRPESTTAESKRASPPDLGK